LRCVHMSNGDDGGVGQAEGGVAGHRVSFVGNGDDTNPRGESLAHGRAGVQASSQDVPSSSV
ncbi:MAG: hypothetical protein ACE1ZX_00920, partial [Acidimicrobiia bacterium]